MGPVEASDWLWKKETGFYSQSAAELLRNPLLPNERFVQDQRMMQLFHRYGNLSNQSRVLEIGCGRSPWLPYLARTTGCDVTGLDIESHAAELARANLAGAGVDGRIYCRDAFDPSLNADLTERFDLVFSLGVVEHLPNVADHLKILARYLKPGGCVVTLVPNLQGLNLGLQLVASRRVLHAHVVYTPETLRTVHEQAGLRTLEAGYLGFFNGFLTSSLGEWSPRRRLHHVCCRSLALLAAVWIRAKLPLPESRWMAPLVFVVGSRPAAAQAKISRREVLRAAMPSA